MSADNWTTCPRCKINHENSRQEQRDEISKAYGNVPPAEYSGLVASYDRHADKPTQTLREDYWQGVDENGEYTCSYGCSCDVCGFSFSFSTKIEAETVLKKSKLK